MQARVHRLLRTSDETVESLLFVVRVVTVQGMIRQFLARRRVDKLRAKKAAEPSDYEKVSLCVCMYVCLSSHACLDVCVKEGLRGFWIFFI